MAVTFTSRLAAVTTPLTHAWEHTIGSGHAPLALRADWQGQLRRCYDEPFAAAYVAKIVLETDPFVDSYSYWVTAMGCPPQPIVHDLVSVRQPRRIGGACEAPHTPAPVCWLVRLPGV